MEIRNKEKEKKIENREGKVGRIASCTLPLSPPSSTSENSLAGWRHNSNHVNSIAESGRL